MDNKSLHPIIQIIVIAVFSMLSVVVLNRVFPTFANRSTVDVQPPNLSEYNIQLYVSSQTTNLVNADVRSELETVFNTSASHTLDAMDNSADALVFDASIFNALSEGELREAYIRGTSIAALGVDLEDFIKAIGSDCLQANFNLVDYNKNTDYLLAYYSIEAEFEHERELLIQTHLDDCNAFPTTKIEGFASFAQGGGSDSFIDEYDRISFYQALEASLQHRESNPNQEGTSNDE